MVAHDGRRGGVDVDVDLDTSSSGHDGRGGVHVDLDTSSSDDEGRGGFDVGGRGGFDVVILLASSGDGGRGGFNVDLSTSSSRHVGRGCVDVDLSTSFSRDVGARYGGRDGFESTSSSHEVGRGCVDLSTSASASVYGGRASSSASAYGGRASSSGDVVGLPTSFSATNGTNVINFISASNFIKEHVDNSLIRNGGLIVVGVDERSKWTDIFLEILNEIKSHTELRLLITSAEHDSSTVPAPVNIVQDFHLQGDSYDRYTPGAVRVVLPVDVITFVRLDSRGFIISKMIVARAIDNHNSIRGAQIFLGILKENQVPLRALPCTTYSGPTAPISASAFRNVRCMDVRAGPLGQILVSADLFTEPARWTIVSSDPSGHLLPSADLSSVQALGNSRSSQHAVWINDMQEAVSKMLQEPKRDQISDEVTLQEPKRDQISDEDSASDDDKKIKARAIFYTYHMDKLPGIFLFLFGLAAAAVGAQRTVVAQRDAQDAGKMTETVLNETALMVLCISSLVLLCTSLTLYGYTGRYQELGCIESKGFKTVGWLALTHHLSVVVLMGLVLIAIEKVSKRILFAVVTAMIMIILSWQMPHKPYKTVVGYLWVGL